MSMTVSNQAALSYGAYALKNSKEYEDYAVDSGEVSKECYNISSISNAVEAMNNALDASGPYTMGKVDSFVRSQLLISQTGIYENLSEKLASYDVDGLLSNDSDLSGMYSLSSASSLISKDAISSILESNGYTASATSSYSSYLEDENEASSLLDVTV